MIDGKSVKSRFLQLTVKKLMALAIKEFLTYAAIPKALTEYIRYPLSLRNSFNLGVDVIKRKVMDGETFLCERNMLTGF